MISIFLILIVFTQENSIFQEMKENLRINLKVVPLKTDLELKKEIEEEILKSNKFLDGLFPIKNFPKDLIKMRFNLLELQTPLVLTILTSTMHVYKAILDFLNATNHEEQMKIIDEVPKNLEREIEKNINKSRKFVKGLDISDRAKELIKINLMQLQDRVKAIGKTEMMNCYQYFMATLEKVNKSQSILNALRESQPFYVTQHDEL